MPLTMKMNCERCGIALAIDASNARICSYECTFCARCADAMNGICPNCSGELVRRPRRKQPVATMEAASTSPGLSKE